MYEFSREYKILIPLFLLVFTYVSLPPYSMPRFWLLPIFCLYIWIKVLVTPFRVKITDENLLVFRSIIKRTVIYPSEIEKILDSTFSFKIITKKGRITISTLMSKPYELKRRIEGLNKKIESEDIELKDMVKAEKKHPLTILLWVFLTITIFLFLLFLRLPDWKID